MFSACVLAYLPSVRFEFIEQHGKSVNIDSTILAVSRRRLRRYLSGSYLRSAACSNRLRFNQRHDSTLTRISRVYLDAVGPEIGVAATKPSHHNFPFSAVSIETIEETREDL